MSQAGILECVRQGNTWLAVHTVETLNVVCFDDQQLTAYLRRHDSAPSKKSISGLVFSGTIRFKSVNMPNVLLLNVWYAFV